VLAPAEACTSVSSRTVRPGAPSGALCGCPGAGARRARAGRAIFHRFFERTAGAAAGVGMQHPDAGRRVASRPRA
jgi:hypothetical protein